MTAAAAVTVDDAAALAQLPGTTLVLPSTLAAGNVPQLACDLLVNTFNMGRLARVRAPQLLPLVGRGALSDLESLNTNAELYYDARRGLAVLQQRAPVARGRSAEYARELAKLVSAAECVVLLVTVNAAARTDAQLGNGGERAPVYYRANGAGRARVHEALGWRELAARGAVAAGDELADSAFSPFAPGSFVQTLFESVSERADGTSCALVAVVTFAHEGDNTVEAHALATACAELVGVPHQGERAGLDCYRWRAPVSWQSLLYGRELDAPI